MEFASTKDQIAHIFTKPLFEEVFEDEIRGLIPHLHSLEWYCCSIVLGRPNCHITKFLEIELFLSGGSKECYWSKS